MDKPTDQDIAATQERLDAFAEALTRGRIYQLDMLPRLRRVDAPRAADQPSGKPRE